MTDIDKIARGLAMELISAIAWGMNALGRCGRMRPERVMTEKEPVK